MARLKITEKIQLMEWLLEDARGESEMGDPAGYSPAELEFLREYWPAAKKWLADRQEERDNGITPAHQRERKEP